MLDHCETLFEPGHLEVRYRPDIDGYGPLLQAVGEASHDSCLVLISREAPPERQIASIDSGRNLGLTHNLGGAPGQCVSFVSIVGAQPG